VLNAIPGLVDAMGTPGTYFDPTSAWGGFLANGGMSQPTSTFSDSGNLDAYTAMPPQDQVDYAISMWQNISGGGNVDPNYAANGAWMINALGEQYVLELTQGTLPPGVTNFIDYLTLHGADGWI
jgi:hypothetical protein